LRTLFETPPMRALGSAVHLPDGREWPGTAQLLVVLYEPGDPNPIGASGYPTAKPLSHYRKQGDLRNYTVRPSPSMRGDGLGPVTLPPDVFAGLGDNALVAIMWRFKADQV
jgi:hypothetical protein